MTKEKLWFLIKRSLIKNKLVGIFNIIIEILICVMILVSSGILNFLQSYSKSAQKYDRKLRATTVFTNSECKEKDVIDLFSGYDFVEIVINQIENRRVLECVNGEGNFGIYVTPCNERCIPEIIHGRKLDFTKANEIILPEKMIVYNNYTEEFMTIYSKELIGKQIKCVKDNVDYNTIYDEAENKVISGGKSIGQSTISLCVVGIYDNTLYYEDSSSCFISEKTSKILCASDIKDRSSDASETIWVIADEPEHRRDIIKVAKENNLICLLVTPESGRVKVLVVVCYILVFIFFLIGVYISGLSFKLDIRKNMNNYIIMSACGYKKNILVKIFLGKYTVLQLVSMVVSIPVAIILLGKVNDFLYYSENMGGHTVKLTLIAVLVSLLLFAVEIFISVCRFYLFISEYKIQEICKNN